MTTPTSLSYYLPQTGDAFICHGTTSMIREKTKNTYNRSNTWNSRPINKRRAFQRNPSVQYNNAHTPTRQVLSQPSTPKRVHFNNNTTVYYY